METNSLPTGSMLEMVMGLARNQEDQLAANLAVPMLLRAWKGSTSTANEGSVHSQTSRSIANSLSTMSFKYDFNRGQKTLQTEINRRCNKIAKHIQYEPKLAADIARDLAHVSRRALKRDQLLSLKCKVVVLATVLQLAPDRRFHQSTFLASRCLWDVETDGSITVQNSFGRDMIAVATAFILAAD